MTDLTRQATVATGMQFGQNIIMTFTADSDSGVDRRNSPIIVNSLGAIVTVLTKRLRHKQLSRNNQCRDGDNKQYTERYKLLRDTLHDFRSFSLRQSGKILSYLTNTVKFVNKEYKVYVAIYPFFLG